MAFPFLLLDFVFHVSECLCHFGQFVREISSQLDMDVAASDPSEMALNSTEADYPHISSYN